jgi:putative transposase
LASPSTLSKLKRVTKKTLTTEELKKIDEIKADQPHLRHRQIQGVLQGQGYYLSPTSVYKHLKANNQIEPYYRREAPWKEARYEVIGINMMWGADWTQLRIAGIRWYLLTLIDFYSRFIIHFEIVPTVNASHIKHLYNVGLSSLNLPKDWPIKPELRVDQGSPNTSKVTRQFFKDIKADLSFARVKRPTDNARTERFYRTIKEEEIYLVGDYPDPKTAHEGIGKYIHYYNYRRPHQSLWNFTPHLVHDINNKSELLKTLQELKRKTWTERKNYWEEIKKIEK